MKWLSLIWIGVLTSCSSPDYKKPDIDVPKAWEQQGSQGPSIADQKWIVVFPIDELNTLIIEALKNNSDLLIAAQRVEIVRAQYGISRSSLFPSLDANAAFVRQRAPGFNPEANQVSESAGLGLVSAAWEIDLWGKLRDQSEAARRDYLANLALYQGAQISLTAQVATLYLDVLDLDNQIRISKRAIDFRKKGLRVNQSRFDAGIASILDVRQAESLLASAEQVFYEQERRLVLAENALSILLGRNPGPIKRVVSLDTLNLPKEMYAGIPSELIERRPDILAAQEALTGAQANVSAAKKEFLPSISLTTSLGFASPALGALFQGGRYAWSLQPSISTSIFNAGRIQFGVDIAESKQEALVQEYKAKIRSAFKEVNDALNNIRNNELERAAGERVVQANTARVRASRARYLSGISPFFEVLDAERQLLDSEIILSQLKRATYQSGVQLYTALGGGWNRSDFRASP